MTTENNLFKIKNGLDTKGLTSDPTPVLGAAQYYNTTSNRWKVFENNTWKYMTNSSTGGINYILNSDAEIDTLGWVTYKETTTVATSNHAINAYNITSASHGLQNGNTIVFSSLTGGSGLSTGTIYNILFVDANTFQVAISSGGGAIDTTTSITASVYVQSKPKTGAQADSPTTTITRNITTPLSDGGDFLITKDAANRQGEGCSYDFTIYNASISKRLSISFDWKTSANYVSGDIGVYIYDVTNSTLIYPNVVNLPAFTSGKAGTPIQIFFNTTTSTSYRLIFHVQSISALAYTCNFDNVQVGPSSVMQTTPTSDWTSYTPTLSGFGTVISQSFFWKQQGDRLLVKGYWINGTIAASLGIIPIPSGLNIDSTKVTTANTTAGAGMFVGSVESNGTLQFTPIVTAVGTSTTQVYTGRDGNAANRLFPVNASTQFGTSQEMSISFEVPIAQWAGSSTNISLSVVEYVSNSSTSTTASDTTSFAYGPAGNKIQSITAGLSRRCRFINPIQSTDVIKLEISQDRITWFPLVNHMLIGDYITTLQLQNTTDYGAGIYSPVSSTDIDIYFAQYSDVNGATYASAGRAWSAGAGSLYWRISKCSNPLSIGQIITPTSQVIAILSGGEAHAYGTTNTKIRQIAGWTTTGTDITPANTDATGTSFTINRAGVYAIYYLDEFAAMGQLLGVSVNSNQLTTSIGTITAANRLCLTSMQVNALAISVSVTVRLNVGDVVRPHTSGGTISADVYLPQFIITQVAI